MNTSTLRIEDFIWDSQYKRYGHILSIAGEKAPIEITEDTPNIMEIVYTDNYHILTTKLSDIEMADGKTYCVKWFPKYAGDCEPSYSYVGAHNEREVRMVLTACFSKVNWVEFYEIDKAEKHYCDFRVCADGAIVRV